MWDNKRFGKRDGRGDGCKQYRRCWYPSSSTVRRHGCSLPTRNDWLVRQSRPKGLQHLMRVFHKRHNKSRPARLIRRLTRLDTYVSRPAPSTWKVEEDRRNARGQGTLVLASRCRPSMPSIHPATSKQPITIEALATVSHGLPLLD